MLARFAGVLSAVVQSPGTIPPRLMVSRYVLPTLRMHLLIYSCLAQNTMKILYNRLRVEGFAVFDGEVEYEDEGNNPVKFMNALTPLVKSGKLKQNEQVFEGIEAVGHAIVAVQDGSSTAKVVVKIANP